MKKGSLIVVLSALTVLLCVCSVALANTCTPTPGAIWTTDEWGAINRNIYVEKCDVLLNGGPAKRNAAGLVEGWYYYKVTDPSGDIDLSAPVKPLADRKVYVTGTGFFDTQAQLCPFEDTPNPGGEYKVWLTSVEAYDLNGGFAPCDSKTDNFKVKKGDDCELGGCECDIAGVKFYDANLNGYLDPEEIGVAGVTIYVYAYLESGDVDYSQPVWSGSTSQYGTYYCGGLPKGKYLVCERWPMGASWIRTCPADSTVDLDTNPYVVVTAKDYAYTIEFLDYATTVANFGNVCIGSGGGKTLGFWSNKNGQRQITSNWSKVTTAGFLNCPVLAGLPYTSATAPYLTSAAGIKTFLLNANAVNMKYMLGAQWLASSLNTTVGWVSPDAMVFTGDGFAKLTDLLAECCTYGGTWDRAEQEWYKNVFDAANNDTSYVQATPCPVVYPD